MEGCGDDGKGVQLINDVRDGVELQNASQRELALFGKLKQCWHFIADYSNRKHDVTRPNNNIKIRKTERKK